jgi:flagellar motor switch protein FliN/FliY
MTPEMQQATYVLRSAEATGLRASGDGGNGAAAELAAGALAQAFRPAPAPGTEASGDPSAVAMVPMLPYAPSRAAEPYAPGGDIFSRFRDVVCPVEVVLGTGHMSLRRVLAIERGSVVRLFQSAGEDLIVSVNNIKLAEAEVIIIDETIAVRVTHLAGSTQERKA